MSLSSFEVIVAAKVSGLTTFSVLFCELLQDVKNVVAQIRITSFFMCLYYFRYAILQKGTNQLANFQSILTIHYLYLPLIDDLD
jgi:C4-dicarboxylate transporter